MITLDSVNKTDILLYDEFSFCQISFLIRLFDHADWFDDANNCFKQVNFVGTQLTLVSQFSSLRQQAANG